MDQIKLLEDDLIFLGAALLLAPKLMAKRSIDDIAPEIETAMASAHFLREAVMKRREAISAGQDVYGVFEYYKRLAKEKGER